jgi:hypothetical protein
MGEVVHLMNSAEIAVRGEEIKLNSAEFLWVCKGVLPPLLPNKPIARDLRQLNVVTPGERRK